MKRLIVISGKQLSGKDTFCKILIEKLPEELNFKRIGIGDAIKLRYGKEKGLTFGEIEAKKHLYRDDLIALGNWGRAQDPDFWLKSIADMDNIIVPDIRVEHEAEFFRKRGAFLVRVNSSPEARAKRGKIVSENDDTETALDCYRNWNFVVENNSDIENLKRQADKIIPKFCNFIGY